MKYLNQFTLILTISLGGELLHALLPLPVPASIYGMAILFCGLASRLIRPGQVRETGLFLVEIMPVTFIPACVGLMDAGSDLTHILLPLCVILPLTTIISMAATGRTAQRILRHKQKNREADHE